MASPMPTVHVVRHGATEWSVSGRHTGRIDLPLTETGEGDARRTAARLGGRAFSLVLTSPLQRAARTCDLAGYGGVAQTDDDLVEWDYGEYEGLKTPEILAARPDWRLFRDGCPGGESPADVAARADRVVARLRAAGGDAIVFSSGHILRVIAARWLGQPPGAGSLLVLGTASVGVLGYDHGVHEPAIRLWNDTAHLRG